MTRIIVITLLLFMSVGAHALDIDNAKRINKSCALCHGVYGQGTPGTLSPRLAGLAPGYLAKEMEFYRSGHRNYMPMTIASSIQDMSDKDINDISEYLAGINLQHLGLPVIPAYPDGDRKQGEELYQEDCKSCHKKNALGNPRKGVPMLAGQYGSYLFNQIKKFQEKERHHDDDPDDETFDDFSDEQIDNLIAYMTTLPANPPQQDTPVAYALGMGSMTGMTSEQAVATMLGMSMGMGMGMADSMNTPWAQGLRLSGTFRVSAEGEIFLNPGNRDMRDLAGTSGEFRIMPDGILFIPYR